MGDIQRQVTSHDGLEFRLKYHVNGGRKVCKPLTGEQIMFREEQAHRRTDGRHGGL